MSSTSSPKKNTIIPENKLVRKHQFAIKKENQIPEAGARHGRIHPHQRETDNNAETIGENIEIENFETDLHETKSLEISSTTR